MFRSWLTGKEPHQRELALQALLNLRTNQLNAELDAVAENTSLPAMLRVKALQSKPGKNEVNPASFDLIAMILADSASDVVSRSSALETLSGSILSPAQLTALPRLFPSVNPVELTRILDLYPGIANLEMARAMAATLPNAPGFGALNHAAIRGWLFGFDPSIGQPVIDAINKLEAEKMQQLDKLNQLVSELPKGDPDRGRDLFTAGKGACSSCHQAEGIGRAVGPSLSGLAKIRQPIDYFESILFPNESIARDYDTYLVNHRDGTSFTGLIQRESEETVHLTELTGTIREMERESILSIEKLPVSLMPAGLENSLTRQELLDLVSWLLSLKN